MQAAYQDFKYLQEDELSGDEGIDRLLNITGQLPLWVELHHSLQLQIAQCL